MEETEKQEMVDSLAVSTKTVGIATGLFAVLQLAGFVIALLMKQGWKSGGGVAIGLLQTVIIVVLAGYNLKFSRRLRETKDTDSLFAALGVLRSMYNFNVVLLVLALGIGLFGFLFTIFGLFK
jgi:hypothetical protein